MCFRPGYVIGGTYQPAFFDKMADSMSGVSIHGFWGLYTGLEGVFVFVLDGERGWRARSWLSMALVMVFVSFLVETKA